MFSERHGRLVLPILGEIRSGVEEITSMITEETANIQAIQVRFKRRDRLHKTLLDQRARVELRRERNNRKVLEGLTVDSRSMDDLYEQTRTLDSLETDFRVTSEQLITKCNQILQNKSKTFHSMFLKFIEVQNTFIYRMSHSCSIPYQELYEHIKFHVPPQDDLDDLGSHPLTWRSREVSDTEGPSETSHIARLASEAPVKSSFSRRATINLSPGSMQDNIPTVPKAYTYDKVSRTSAAGASSTSSPVRRATTTSLFDETVRSPNGH
jgi:hypothetical protein